MAATVTVLREADVPAQQLSELKRKARRMGMTPAAYIKQLIEDDLTLDRKARRTPLDELAAPFRKGLKHVSDDELDRPAGGRDPALHAAAGHSVRSAKRDRRS